MHHSLSPRVALGSWIEKPARIWESSFLDIPGMISQKVLVNIPAEVEIV